MMISTILVGQIVFGLLILVVLTQTGYYLFVFRKLAYYKPKNKQKTQEYPVSVVICGKNEAANLATHLPGVLVQEYATTHEIIVVNDNSTDETKYLLEHFQKQFKVLQILPLVQDAMGIPGKKFPLSMGIKAAKYEILLLTDADCVPASEQWIQRMQSAYEEGIDIVLGYGAYNKKKGFLNQLIRFETFHTALQYLGFALSGQPYMGVGRNLSYKRELFLKNKGFASINHIPGGDDDLFIGKVARKNNTAVVLDAQAHTLSEPPTTWSAWMRQKNRHYTTAKYYKPKFKWMLGLYAASGFLVYPALIAAALLFNWWMAVCVYAIRMLVLAIIWKKAMKQLNEQDLWSKFIIFDLWMFLYYFMMAPSLWKKPAKKWK